MTKNEWKSILNRKINVYWWNNIKHSTKSLQFLNTEKCYPGKMHTLLSINCKSSRDVNRIPTKLKLLTGTYILQNNRAKYKNYTIDPTCLLNYTIDPTCLLNYTIDPTCLLCDSEAETPAYFILNCPALSSIRNPITAELQFILQQNHNIQYNTLSNDDKLQIILDCTHLIKSQRKIDFLEKIEFQNHRLLHNLHSARYRILMNIKSS